MLAVTASLLLVLVAETVSKDVVVKISDDFEIVGQESNGVSSFLGVPYAAAPVGPLRFKDPQPYQPSVKSFKAYNLGNICMQTPDPLLPSLGSMGTESEDCLFLNIYTPDVKGNKPVMVFFHGGGFLIGTGNTYPGTAFAAFNHTVIVTVNYRLGPFGFMFDGSKDLPGNQGLKDQAFALGMVKNMVGKFGGDPNRITIFGESAGAASVGYHVLRQAASSNSSEKRFHRAIMESGTPTAPYAYTPPEYAKTIALQFMDGLNCKENDYNCARNATAQDLVKIAQKVRTFSPTVDTDTVTQPPADLLRSGSFDRDIPLVIGYNKQEGWLFAPLMWSEFHSISSNGSNEEFATTDKIYENGIQAIFQYFRNLYINNDWMPAQVPTECMESALYEKYSDWDPPSSPKKRAMAIGEFTSDVWFKVSTVNFLAPFTQAYLYEYSYASSGASRVLKTQPWMMPVHTAELFSVFGFPLSPGPPTWSDSDKNVAKLTMGYWSEFAEKGSIDTWQVYNSTRGQKYNDISEQLTTKSYPRYNYARFWNERVLQLAKVCRATPITTTPISTPTTTRSSETTTRSSERSTPIMALFAVATFLHAV